MGKHFFDASGYAGITTYDRISAERTIRALLEGGVFLVAENDGEVVGSIGVLIYPLYFNSGHLTAQEMFWWVEPEHRGCGNDLRIAVEMECQKRGVRTVTMIALESHNGVGKLYERAGYSPMEHSYMKRL